ncbi:MAG TPA: TRAM domain-containing protein [Chlamydiales bacterium]|nr:TRAM domain-containing protein [Chlamydiales bacterium]
MNLALAFTRTLFMILSIFFMTTYMISGPGGYTHTNLGLGLGLGLLLGLGLIGFDLLFKRFNLRAFNVAIIGLFAGYLMGQALVLVLSAILEISSASIHLQPQSLEVLKIALFLFGVYLGTLMTIRASDELYVSIPFVKFTPTAHKKKDLVIDSSVLSDPRIIDLASSGIVDHHLVLPRFLVKELYIQAEASDESIRSKAKRSLEIVKKLEGFPELELRYNDTDFPDVKDPTAKMIRLARLLDANILTADLSRVQTAAIEGVRFINIHALSNALKPLMQAGEHIKIKIQRYGKEPRQGVGYLEDGTMVVVNGGGEYIGEIIEAKVLSVKHTTSGRMIFCNAQDEEGGYHSYDEEGQ